MNIQNRVKYIQKYKKKTIYKKIILKEIIIIKINGQYLVEMNKYYH